MLYDVRKVDSLATGWRHAYPRHGLPGQRSDRTPRPLCFERVTVRYSGVDRNESPLRHAIVGLKADRHVSRTQKDHTR